MLRRSSRCSLASSWVSTRLVAIGGLLALSPLSALGQVVAEEPDEAWEAYPGAPASPPPPDDQRTSLRPAPLPPPPPSERPSPPPRAVLRPPRPEDFNRVSMYGAPSLGPFNRGLGVYLGFPLFGLRAGVGVADGLDVGVGFDSYYGMMNELRAHARLQLFGEGGWSAALAVEGGWALFTQRAEAENHGARWLTGRRNFNLLPGVVLTHRGDSPRSARIFLDVRYHFAFDTEPFVTEPLSGVPPPVVIGHNFPVRAGAEMPFSPRTSFLFLFGFDLHGRPIDSAFMPACSVGLVTAI